MAIKTASGGAAGIITGRDNRAVTWGINAQGVFRLASGSWPTHLDAIELLGVEEVRAEANWDDAENVQGQTLSWTVHDARMTALAQRDLRWYALMAYSTDWAGSDTYLSAPLAEHYDSYATYCGAMAARYKLGGAFWTANPSLTARRPAYEIWNEPNTDPFWGTQTTAPEDYADLFVQAATAIKTADPDAHVTVGSLSIGTAAGATAVATFIERMMDAEPTIATLADALSFHSYGDNATGPDRIRQCRAAMDANGLDHLPIEITETGWDVPTITEPERAARFLFLPTQLQKLGVTRFHPYTWYESGDAFSIADASAVLTQTARTYRDYVQQLG